jgi:hypothetical protein
MRLDPRLTVPLAPLGLLLLAGCATQFTPASVVEDLRVLAIVADPPELRLTPAAGTNSVTVLRATAVAPPASPGGQPRAPAPADVAWSFCPFSIGASTGYACAVPDCESTLQAAGDGSVTLDPVAELMKPACQAALAGLAGGSPGGPAAGGSIETLVRYVATLDGLRREAVQRIPVWFGTPPATPPNLNPIIGAVAAGTDCAGSAAPCSVASVSLDVAIDPASFQPYPAGTDRTVEETIVVSFFTTAGRFKYEYGSTTVAAPSTGTVLEAKELGAATEALVWVVARDLRGGEAVQGPITVVFSR